MGGERYRVRDIKISLFYSYESKRGNIRLYSDRNMVQGYICNTDKRHSFVVPDCTCLPDEGFMKELVKTVNKCVPHAFNKKEVECIEIDCVVKNICGDIIKKDTIYRVAFYCNKQKNGLPQYQVTDENGELISNI